MDRTFRSLFILVFCALFLAVGVVISGSDPLCSEKGPDEREIGPTKTLEVTIQKKMKWSLLTKELNVVRVGKYTAYTDQAGSKIRYDRLAVPCKAVLVYEPEPQGDPVAVGITVKSFLPGASSLIEVVPQ